MYRLLVLLSLHRYGAPLGRRNEVYLVSSPDEFAGSPALVAVGSSDGFAGSPTLVAVGSSDGFAGSPSRVHLCRGARTLLALR